MHRLIEKLVGHTRKPRRRTPVNRNRLRLERLEDRLLLSNIVWDNQGADGFETYDFLNGAGTANIARNIVNHAISAWETVITSFNYNLVPNALDPSSMHFPYWDDAFHLEISVADLEGNLMGATHPCPAIDPDGKPYDGTIEFDINAAGGGWFFDTTPGDHVEFDSPTSPFSALASSGAAQAGIDFYTVVLHEIGHALGFESSVGPIVDHTSASTFPNDLMNPSVGPGERRLISDTDLKLLAGAYGYSVASPFDLPNFTYLVGLSDSGQLIVQGDADTDDIDSIMLSRNGNDLVVGIDGWLSVPVPMSSVSAVHVLAGTGADSVQILLDGDPIPTGGIFVDGGDANDGLVIQGTSAGETFLMLGGTLSTPFGIVSFVNLEGLTVAGEGGVDSLQALGIPAALDTLLLRGGGGSDTIDVYLNDASTDVLVLGESGQDSLAVHDAHNSGDYDYELRHEKIVRPGYGSVTYKSISSLELYASSGDNEIDVVENFIPTSIDAGLGDDTVVVGIDPKVSILSGSLSQILAPLTVVGGGVGSSGYDVIWLHDEQNREVPKTATIDHKTVGAGPTDNLFGSGGWLNYSDLSDLQLRLGDLGDTIYVPSTAAGTDVLLFSADGDDTIVIGGSVMGRREGSADGILSHVDVIGFAGDDTLTINDSSAQVSKTVSVTDTEIGGESGDSIFGTSGKVTYTEIEDLRLRLGAGSDTIEVLATNAATDTRLYAGAGDDRVNVGNAASGLDDLLGQLHVYGQQQQLAPYDVLTINDQGASAGQFYGLNANSLWRSGAAPIYYVGVEALVINAGGFDDVFTVHSTAASTLVTIYAGAGSDTIDVGNVSDTLAGVLGRLIVDGQSGDDGLTLRDFGTLSGQTYDLSPSTAWSMLARSGGVNVEYTDVGDVTLQAGNHADSLQVLAPLTAGQNPLHFAAGGGNDTLLGPDADTTWNLAGSDKGDLAGVVSFDAVEDLVGGNKADQFVFGDGVSGFANVDGGNGTDTLDYSAYTSPVAVDLLASTATGIVSLAPGTIENATGGSRDDRLVGDHNKNVLVGTDGDDILVGHGGDDRLVGALGRDLLIGGADKDLLDGGDGEDIVIGGTTSYDMNPAALDAIMAEWKRTDLAYSKRVHVLRTGQGWNGPTVYPLDGVNVFDDGVTDKLFGSQDLDWFWAWNDSLDKEKGELVN